MHFKCLEFVWTSASLSDVGQTAEPLTVEQDRAQVPPKRVAAWSQPLLVEPRKLLKKWIELN